MLAVSLFTEVCLDIGISRATRLMRDSPRGLRSPRFFHVAISPFVIT